MCTNSALLETLECYMEDMVQCFEEFVKKTLFVVSVAAGALIAMVMYLMKNVNRRRCVTGAETQIDDAPSSCLRQGYSTSCIRTDRKISPQNSYTKTSSDFSMSGKNKCGKTMEVTTSQNVIVDSSPMCPKRSISCCSGKILPSCLKLPKCPGSASKICVRKSSCRFPPCSPPSCSQTSSCESLQSRSSCRGSDSSICLKKPCTSKPSCGTPLLCANIPPCPLPPCKRSCGPTPGCRRSCLPAPACKRSCSPAPCRQRPCQRACSPVPSSTRTCSPTPSCIRTCSKLGRITVPSLMTCNQPKYKLELPACATIKPCNIPERCPSKPCFKPHRKGSCCSMCCED